MPKTYSPEQQASFAELKRQSHQDAMKLRYAMLAYIARRCGWGQEHITIKTLMAKFKIARCTALRHLRWLQDKGWIRRIKSWRQGGGQASTIYEIGTILPTFVVKMLAGIKKRTNPWVAFHSKSMGLTFMQSINEINLPLQENLSKERELRSTPFIRLSLSGPETYSGQLGTRVPRVAGRPFRKFTKMEPCTDACHWYEGHRYERLVCSHPKQWVYLPHVTLSRTRMRNVATRQNRQDDAEFNDHAYRVLEGERLSHWERESLTPWQRLILKHYAVGFLGQDIPNLRKLATYVGDGDTQAGIRTLILGDNAFTNFLYWLASDTDYRVVDQIKRDGKWHNVRRWVTPLPPSLYDQNSKSDNDRHKKIARSAGWQPLRSIMAPKNSHILRDEWDQFQDQLAMFV